MRQPLVFALVALGAACADEAPAQPDPRLGSRRSDRGPARADAGGRVLELPIAEGDRIDTGALIVRLDARDTELAIAARQAERATAEAQLRLLLAGSRARGHPAGRRAGRDRACGCRGSARPSSQSAEQDLRALRGAAAQRTPARASSETMRRRGEMWRGTVWRRPRVVCVPPGKRVGSPARGRPARRDRRGACACRGDGRAGRHHFRRRSRMPTLDRTDRRRRHRQARRGRRGDRAAHAGGGDHRPRSRVGGRVRAGADRCRASRVGQAATLFTDAGGSGITGTITWISPKAEFTPRNVQTADERSKLVYRVRVTVDNSEGVLKQGMPVEAEIPLTRAADATDSLTQVRSRAQPIAPPSPSIASSSATARRRRRRSVVRGRARRDVRPDRSGRRREDDLDPSAVRAAARRRRHGCGCSAGIRSPSIAR